MRIISFLLFVFLGYGVSSQETETESSTEFTVTGQNTDQVTANDVYQRRKTSRLVSQSNISYKPMYGTRMTETTESSTTPRFSAGSNDFAGVQSENQANQQSPDTIQYPPANGMFRFPPALYYPEALDPRDSYQYPVSLENLYRSPYAEDSDASNITSPYISVHPGFSAARIYRRERYPVPFGTIENDEYLLRNEPSVINVGDPVPFVPYPFSSYFLPPAVPARTDEKELDIFVRPSYFDRESGTDTVENAPLRKEVPKELPVIEQKEDIGSTFADAAAPAENIPTRFIPRRPFPPSDFPFGIPPPEILPPYAYPQAPVPPMIPPIAPQFSAPTNGNFLNSVLDKPVSQPANIESIPEELSPVENNTPDAAGVIPSDDYVDNEAKLPYEFGYEMNDGMGNDQHRKEVSDGSGAVSGSYGYRDPYGMYRIVNYVADKYGFRAFIQSNEPGMANPGSADAAVVAEVPPPKAIAEGLRTLNADAVAVPNEPVEIESGVVENK